MGVCNVTCYFATRPAIRARKLNQFCHFFFFGKKVLFSLSRKGTGLIQLAGRPLKLIGRFCGHGLVLKIAETTFLHILYKWLLHHHHLLIPIRPLNEPDLPHKDGEVHCWIRVMRQMTWEQMTEKVSEKGIRSEGKDPNKSHSCIHCVLIHCLVQ